MIELRTLGSLELTSAESATAGGVLAQPRRAALLCYLALALPRGFHRRDTLLALFWPEDNAERARHALRQSVYYLRRALSANAIVSRGDDELSLASGQVVCDAWEFETAVAEGRAMDALSLYKGELLAGFHVSDAPDFERWLETERARLRELAREAAWTLSAAREHGGDSAGAAEAARRAVALAPVDEIALRRLVLLLARIGDRAGAVRAYETFAKSLREEYELELSAETQMLVAKIRAESVEPATAALGQVSDPSVAGQMERSEEGLQDPPIFASPARAPRARGLVAATLIVALLLALAAGQSRTQSRVRIAAAHPPAIGAPTPAIAVLPFASPDRQLSSWGEGLVDLISLDLSGIPGLRAVDSRTMLARWRERVATGGVPDLTTALDVAERTGARYAVMGSVMARGSDLVLTGAVHELAGRRVLATARSEAPADSIFALVDRFALEVIRLIPRGDTQELPRIDLARVSTSSLPALRSYLEGEVLFRQSRFQGAAEAYARAIVADSTFALARYRLGLSREWFWTDIKGSSPNPLDAAVGRFASRLPQSEGALFRAIQLREQDIRAAREMVEEEVRRHPDNAETWYQLGELYYHSGDQALVPRGTADRAFQKSIELDSTFSLTYIHRIEYAMTVGDTTGAAALLGTYARLAPQSRYLAQLRLAAQLAFGDSATHSKMNGAIDTLDNEHLFGLGMMLAEQGRWELAERVFLKARERDELRPEATRPLFFVALAEGKTGEAHRWVNDPFMPHYPNGLMLQMLDEIGAPISVMELDSALGRGSPDSADAFRLFSVGAYQSTRAHWQDARRTLQQLQLRAQRLRKRGDGSEAIFTEAVRQALEGYVLWRKGDRESALRLLQRSQPLAVGGGQRAVVNMRLRWWLAKLLLEMGRPREALPYFDSLTKSWFPADYQRARIYEQLGMAERARDAYAVFLDQYQHADTVFQPMVRDAGAGLERLAQATPE